MTEETLLALGLTQGFINFDEDRGYSIQAEQLPAYLETLKQLLQAHYAPRTELIDESLPLLPTAPRVFVEEKQNALSPKYLVYNH